MLSIKNITSGQAMDYYKKDDYYTRDEGGVWQGELRDKLGFGNQVNKDDFERFIKMNEERAGFDLCFSAPKSVSLAFCIDEHRENILAAHSKAVEDTLKLIEKNEIFARVTEDRITRRVQTNNMLCAKFNHYVSRNQDPQLHTHCVVLNFTFYNGKKYAISNENLYDYKMLYGQIYRNYLARNLQEMGYDLNITDREKGLFELAGVDQEVIDKFSSRRQEIVKKLEEMGDFSSKAAEIATLKTRKAKEHKNFKILLDSWKSDLNEFGFKLERGEREEFIKSNFAPLFERAKMNISRQTFAFTDKEFYEEALKCSLGSGATIGDAENYLDQQLKDKRMYFLGDLDDKKYFCTKESYELEQSVFKKVDNGKNKVYGINLDKVNTLLENTSLNDEQKEAVRHICCSRDRYLAVVGLAGTGKTYMLKHARDIFESEGYKVYGMSLAGQAARNLEDESGIESRTIHSFLNQLEKEAGKFNPNQDLENKSNWDTVGIHKNEKEVWIVDEASMINNNLFNELCKAAEERGSKVVFIGDNKQLQAIGAGSSFDNMVRKNRISYVVLENIRRQKDQELKEAVIEAVKGDVNRSLNILSSRTIEIKDRETRLKKIADDYSFQRSDDREKSIILTGSNYDRHEINGYVRDNLKGLGVLKENRGHEFILRTNNGHKMKRELLENDKIVFLRNDNKLGVRNGQAGYIKKIEGNNIWCETNNKLLKIDVNNYNYLDYGYALTVHKAQGQTVNKAFVHINTDQKKLNSRNSYYVDISRAKYDVKIYTNDKERLYKAVSKFDIKLSSDDFSFKREVKGISSTDWLKFKQEHMDLDRNLQLKKEIHMG